MTSTPPNPFQAGSTEPGESVMIAIVHPGRRVGERRSAHERSSDEQTIYNFLTGA